LKSKQKLSDVIQVNPIRHLKKGDIAPFVAMQDIAPYEKIISEFSQRKVSGSNKTFQNSDTLLAKITPSLENGKTAFVDILKENEIGHGSTEFIVLCGKENQTLDQFVYYLMRMPEFREEAIRSMTGTSGRQRVQETIFDDYEIVLPSLSIQEKITKTLSDLDTKIHNLQNQNHTLERIAQAIFKSWFVDFDGVTEFEDSELGQIPKGWKIKTIEELVNHQKGFVFKSSDYQTHGKRIIRISDLTKDSIDLQNCLFIDEQKVQEQKHQSVILNENDIVITTVGSNLNHPESAVGRPIRVPTFTAGSLLNQNMVRLRCINPDLQLFLLKNIQHAKFIDYLSARTQGSANQASITLGVIFDYSILLPNDDNLLKKFSLLSESIYQKINKNQIQIISLTKTRDALLPKLMSGEIRV